MVKSKDIIDDIEYEKFEQLGCPENEDIDSQNYGKHFSLLDNDGQVTIAFEVISVLDEEKKAFVRSYLEDDAMIKARFLAKEYMEDIKISDENEIKKIIDEYDKLNNIGIKTVNYKLFSKKRSVSNKFFENKYLLNASKLYIDIIFSSMFFTIFM